MSKTVVRRITATPVRVPARPDSLNSPGVEETDRKFAEKFHTGASWTDFPLELKWIVEMETADGACGIGETYRGPTREQVDEDLRPFAGKDVLRLEWRHLPVRDMRIYDAVESAVLDLAGKNFGVPVYQLLGGACRDRVECSGWTGRRTPEDAARKAFEAMQAGHRVFKFKCSDKDSVRDWSTKIRERCGNGIKLLLDPNQRWHDAATTLRLMEGVDPDIMYALEDPVERTDFVGFREVRKALGIPMYIHISNPYSQNMGDVITALREDAIDGFNFNGPMIQFVELASTAALAGMNCWHGSEVDLGILEVSALHAAAATPNCTVPSDIFGELVREDDLIVEPIRFERAHALVPQGVGLAIELDRAAVERYRAGASTVIENS